MPNKLLLTQNTNHYFVKEIAVFEQPERLKPVLHELSWKILQLISKNEMYPMAIAKTLNIHEQKVYYHIKKLVNAGVINAVREEETKGAVAKYYRASFPALGVELPFGEKTIQSLPFRSVPEKMRRFLASFATSGGAFDGLIVVGSPDPHGPFKARARDGHYASFLTLFLGRFLDLPEDFIIKLDVDVKAEKAERNNLILVGGPGTNLITQEINPFLPIRFNMQRSKHGFLLGGLVSQKTKNVYASDSAGVIAKIANPWNTKREILVLAGNKAVGTKACVLAITKFWRETLTHFRMGEFATVIQGFDLDGDGKVDAVEVVE